MRLNDRIYDGWRKDRGWGGFKNEMDDNTGTGSGSTTVTGSAVPTVTVTGSSSSSGSNSMSENPNPTLIDIFSNKLKALIRNVSSQLFAWIIFTCSTELKISFPLTTF